MRLPLFLLVAATVCSLPACSVTQSSAGGPAVVTSDVPVVGPRSFTVDQAAPGSGMTFRFGGAAPTLPGGTLPPPANLLDGQPPPSTAPGVPPSGVFAGEMISLNNPGGNCRPGNPVRNWRVDGNRVRFGGWRGTIRPDGTLNMQLGSSRISGQFFGPNFLGELWTPGLSCDYRLRLSLAG